MRPTSPVDGKMYLPVLISVYEILNSLRENLPETEGVDMTIVVKTMLDRIFYERVPTFGELQGAFGAYIQQAPNQLTMSDYDIDLILHEAEIQLMDHLTGVLPMLSMNMADYFYNYPGGENQPNLYIYVPMDPTTCPPEYRSKLLPGHAIRYSAR